MIIIKCFWISYCDILFSLKLLLANDMHLTPVCKSTVSLGKKKKKKSTVCFAIKLAPAIFKAAWHPVGYGQPSLMRCSSPPKRWKMFSLWCQWTGSALWCQLYSHQMELQTCPDCYCNSLIRPGTQCYLSDGWREMRRKGSQKIFKGLDDNVKNLEHV